MDILKAAIILLSLMPPSFGGYGEEKGQEPKKEVNKEKAKKPEKVKEAPKRKSGNGSEVPSGAHVATFKVESHDAGYKALSGQPGVLEVVKAKRLRPRGQWVVVYFDGSKNDRSKLLKRLQDEGCKKAAEATSKALVEEGVTIKVSNPVCTAGDMVQCTVQFPEGEPGKVRVAPPPGWIPLPLAKKAEDGLLRLDIQSPKRAKTGRHSVTVMITPDGKKERSVKVPVEMVALVATPKK